MRATTRAAEYGQGMTEASKRVREHALTLGSQGRAVCACSRLVVRVALTPLPAADSCGKGEHEEKDSKSAARHDNDLSVFLSSGTRAVVIGNNGEQDRTTSGGRTRARE